ncbi:acyltransferase 3 [Plectosphaerella cucumerina]|jgi:peptidoglycan/LPS O-acetylase OafA/YrhL|uniref:Acyltransferase 3 n=1 Tax=Plectosphaerella cucumerina TaxID=40658 RepID=A0A8K0X5B2_9PEZI|nr:acyltransferase 3 [Plectosphaerella cucumerina]
MLPNGGEGHARAHDEAASELASWSNGHHHIGADKSPAPTARRTGVREKIKCLDGLRGIACLLVFNYHFLWPWTPTIMLGYGAMPPYSAQPYTEWSSLPIICLLQRGRPMVAIFFAISGYVVCRHIIRAIHERRLEAAYQALASAAFRRTFRLYIPPTISMFLVAMLAQVGVFRPEADIYKGPDSVYINSTITIGQLGVECINGSRPAIGAGGVADDLGLHNALYLGNLTQWTGSLCLNDSSALLGPSTIYHIASGYESKFPNDTDALTKLAPNAWVAPYYNPSPIDIGDGSKKATDGLNVTWIHLGGSWEEHPFIHDNITYALKNFTRSYAEWANPFNFGHYHPRYDPHTFTIPMELRGSMLLYIFLLATAALKANWRMGFAGTLSAYSLWIGRWDMSAFLGGALLSEVDIRNSSERTLAPPATETTRYRHDSRATRAARWAAIILALYFLSYPDAGAEYTPGFLYLSTWVPKYYIPLSGWMFYQSMGALILVACILRSPTLSGLLERPVPQYLGKVSFSLYLVHGPVLHSLGFWIMPRLFDSFGRPLGYLIGYVVLLSVTMYLTSLWHRKIDAWSITVGKRVERLLTV